jgi:hypothetical protein
MRKIKDPARAMLNKEKLPEFLWREAVGTSVYLHNRMVNRNNPTPTPFE